MVTWFGETQPLVPNTNETARYQNRRVVIKNTLKAFDLPISGNQPVVMQVKCMRGQVEAVVADGDTLTTEDRYAVEFKTTNNLHVYVYQVDAMGKSVALFPNSRFVKSNNPVSANSFRRLPAPGRWFYLDNNLGTEQIILIAAKNPIDDPNSFCANLIAGEKEAHLLAVESDAEFKTRGLGGIIHQANEKTDVEDDLSANSKTLYAESKVPGNVYVVQRVFIHE
ncbi:hypothetical protein DSCO28_54380 [Desulfosarcina ovata subsp. sediminis]|uniref:OmpA-like domain-containing protein n=1 Tax=Desulfosarcina ovata subsp. sediminis TaxID=885957 RepID=A0A5K7ZX96_9BACT|nr:DUF4384 domain-containing protein [Desulfosarcina ovata]BBO84872.1 hypothetical protein DSCO28_54380 [Desulfosarcina ovata subsp. sediminis]